MKFYNIQNTDFKLINNYIALPIHFLSHIASFRIVQSLIKLTKRDI